MTQITDVTSPLITSPPPPTHYLHSHITAPHTPPDCPPALITPTYCGELSGAISGGVHCFGYLRLGSHLVYLNMGGPRMAVEAIRARLSRGEGIHLTPEDGDPITFEVNDMGKFEDYAENMSQHHFQNTLLIHRNMTPNYREKDKLTFAFIMAQSPKQVYHVFHQHLHKLLGIAVFPHWIPTLWATGMSADIILKCEGVGAGGYGVYLKWEDWQSIIAIGVSTGVLPLSETGETAQTVTIIPRPQPQLDSPTPPQEETASPAQADTDPIQTVIQDKLGYTHGDARLTIFTRDVYATLRKHARSGWETKTSIQVEMHTALYDYFQNRIGQTHTTTEIAHIAHSLVQCAKMLNLSPDIPYPDTMDTAGKRALYRTVGEQETLVLLLDEDIHRLKQDSWRGNAFKERNIQHIIARHLTDETLASKVFWVIKTHEEY